MRNPRVLCNIHGNSPSGLRPRARPGIFLGLMLYLLHAIRCLYHCSKQGELYSMDNRQDNPVGKGSVVVPVPSTEVNPAYDAVKYTQGEDTYETVH